ncbi:MAG: radical SAM protein [Solirubrobacterales bacterium]|nr:radical SAM protein [Solirubrobacterales bacterium]
MRWDGQRVTADGRPAETGGEPTLPGMEDAGLGAVRTFSAPEAMGTRFHEVRAKSALNRVPEGPYGFGWTVNPYRGCSHACVYCFARPTHTYLGFNAGRDFEKEIVVKVNVPEVLRTELSRPSWKRELVALGTNTDPYQWVESRYRLTREVLEALDEAETPVSVLTKSPLVLSDLPVFERMNRARPIGVNLSVPTVDEKAWRSTEPHTPSPRARLEAVAELRRRGIPSGILIAPIMPGINDRPDQIEPILRAASEADADFVTPIALNLRKETRTVFFDWLKGERPDLVPEYESLFSGRARLPKADQQRITSAARGRYRRRRTGERDSPPMRPPGAIPKAKPAAKPAEQGSLFDQ